MVCKFIYCQEKANSQSLSLFTGVFVITHISTCRNGAGYCILGFSCEVDKDFTKDDLGGHCSGLGAAFNPKAQFVCCRENPELHPPKVVVAPQITDHDIVIEAVSSTTTEGTLLLSYNP